jgi:hypothetical protein
LRDRFVMAAAGTDPPWPPLLKGGKRKGETLLKRGKRKRENLLKGGKLGATFRLGNLRSR